MPPDLSLGAQLVWLFTLAIPVASVAWTVTQEEVLREPRDYCIERSENARTWYQRKFFYLFTCEYCFSHYVALGALLLTRFQLLMDGVVGYLLAWFALVWVSNLYMGIYARLRVGIKSERTEIKVMEDQLDDESQS